MPEDVLDDIGLIALFDAGDLLHAHNYRPPTRARRHGSVNQNSVN